MLCAKWPRPNSTNCHAWVCCVQNGLGLTQQFERCWLINDVTYQFKETAGTQPRYMCKISKNTRMLIFRCYLPIVPASLQGNSCSRRLGKRKSHHGADRCAILSTRTWFWYHKYSKTHENPDHGVQRYEKLPVLCRWFQEDTLMKHVGRSMCSCWSVLPLLSLIASFNQLKGRKIVLMCCSIPNRVYPLFGQSHALLLQLEYCEPPARSPTLHLRAYIGAIGRQ